MIQKNNIKKITETIAQLATLLALLAIVSYAGKSIIDYTHEILKPKVEDELFEIKIGEKISDVLFKNPDFYEDKKFDDYIMYRNEKGNKKFITSDGIVKELFYSCKDGDTTTEIAGISCNSKGEKILDKFGRDVKVLCLQENDAMKNKRRIYAIKKHGVEFVLEYNKVMYVVVKPNRPISLGWSECV